MAPHLGQHLRLVVVRGGQGGVSALTWQCCPGLAGLYHTAHAQPRAWADHGQHPLGTWQGTVRAQLVRLQPRQRQSQRLEVVEQAQLLQPQGLLHARA